MRWMGQLFASKPAPIGVDLGSASLKLAQLEADGAGGFTLMAVASADVPDSLRKTPAGRLEFFERTIGSMLKRGAFRGRRVVLGLPASLMHFYRLRLPHGLDEPSLKNVVLEESVGKLPFHPSRALLRHLTAGKIFEHDEPKIEVVVMAVLRELTERFLAAAARARLDVVGVRPEPLAILDCFCAAPGAPESSNRAESKDRADPVRGFVDIGNMGARLYIGRGTSMEFARAVLFEHDLAIMAAEAAVAPESEDAATELRLKQLIYELDLSRRYHAATFPHSRIDELIFIGGGARQRPRCAQIARSLGIAARVGNPIPGLKIAGGAGDVAADERAALSVAMGLSSWGMSMAA